MKMTDTPVVVFLTAIVTAFVMGGGSLVWLDTHINEKVSKIKPELVREIKEDMQRNLSVSKPVEPFGSQVRDNADLIAKAVAGSPQFIKEVKNVLGRAPVSQPGSPDSVKLCKTVALHNAWSSVTAVPFWLSQEGCRQLAIAQFGSSAGGEAEYGCLFSDGSAEFSRTGNKARLGKCGW